MSSRYDFQVSGGGGGGGAPANATYLTLSLDGTLTNERVFTPGATLGAVDGGAGGLYTLDIASGVVGAGAYAYPSSVTVDTYGRVTAIVAGAAPVSSGWTDGGTTVYLTTATDVVSVGSNVGVANRKLSITNTGTDLGLSVLALASTDNVLDAKVVGDAADRVQIVTSGDILLGSGAGAADLRLRRSNTSTLTIDNNGTGAAVIVPGSDGVGSFGTNALRWSDNIANTHRVFPSAGAVNASTSLGSGFLKLGAGGASALDTAITRTAAATLTVDNNAGGSAILIVKGTTSTQQRLHNITSKTFADSGYTVSATDDTIFWNASGGNSTLNLVTPVGAGGREIVIKRTDTSANTLTVTPAAGQIEGAASLVIAGGASRASFTLRSDNANWWIV